MHMHIRSMACIQYAVNTLTLTFNGSTIVFLKVQNSLRLSGCFWFKVANHSDERTICCVINIKQ